MEPALCWAFYTRPSTKFHNNPNGCYEQANRGTERSPQVCRSGLDHQAPCWTLRVEQDASVGPAPPRGPRPLSPPRLQGKIASLGSPPPTAG